MVVIPAVAAPIPNPTMPCSHRGELNTLISPIRLNIFMHLSVRNSIFYELERNYNKLILLLNSLSTEYIEEHWSEWHL